MRQQGGRCLNGDAQELTQLLQCIPPCNHSGAFWKAPNRGITSTPGKKEIPSGRKRKKPKESKTYRRPDTAQNRNHPCFSSAAQLVKPTVCHTGSRELAQRLKADLSFSAPVPCRTGEGSDLWGTSPGRGRLRRQPEAPRDRDTLRAALHHAKDCPRVPRTEGPGRRRQAEAVMGFPSPALAAELRSPLGTHLQPGLHL